MKKFRENKLLWIAIAGGLAGALLLLGVLACSMDEVVRDETIETAESQAEVTPSPLVAEESAHDDASPKVKQTPAPLAADTLEKVDFDNQQRRSTLIPNLGVAGFCTDSWEGFKPEGCEIKAQKAVDRAIEYAMKIFNADIGSVTVETWAVAEDVVVTNIGGELFIGDKPTGSVIVSEDGTLFFICYNGFVDEYGQAADADDGTVTVTPITIDKEVAFYRDKLGYRPNIVQVSLNGGEYLCTMCMDDLSLVNIDRAITPSGLSCAPVELANMLAEMFGGTTSSIPLLKASTSTDYSNAAYGVVLADGRCLGFNMINGELCAVGVMYPDESALWEVPYFGADIRQTYPIVTKANERASFVVGEPSEGDMSRADAEMLYRTFLRWAAGDPANDSRAKTEYTFYVDETGLYESYWHIEGDEAIMDLAAVSGAIISLQCGNLYNDDAGENLTKVAYEDMGGEEYERYVHIIAVRLFGEERVADVSVNAVADDHYCTMLLTLTDDSLYEFFFTDGKLTKVEYTFDKQYYGCGTGWPQDMQYVNTLTGETFYREP